VEKNMHAYWSNHAYGPQAARGIFIKNIYVREMAYTTTKNKWIQYGTGIWYGGLSKKCCALGVIDTACKKLRWNIEHIANSKLSSKWLY
jgi:hypothetical protein